MLTFVNKGKITSELQDSSVVRSRSVVMYPAMVHRKIHSRRGEGGILNWNSTVELVRMLMPIMNIYL